MPQAEYMKSFHYTAINQQGEKITGTVKSHEFADATQQIRSQGLELVSLEQAEQQIVEQMRPYLFEAIDQDGEEVQGAVPGKDEEQVLKTLQEQYGYQVTELHQRETSQGEESEVVHVPVEAEPEEGEEEREGKSDGMDVNDHNQSPVTFDHRPSTDQPDHQKAESQPSPKQPDDQESILFSKKATVQEQKKIFPVKDKTAAQLEEAEQQLGNIIEKNESVLSEITRNRLEHLQGKIELLRESPDKKRLRNFQRELKRVQKMAEREIKEHEQKRWEEYEKKGGSDISYEKFEQDENTNTVHVDSSKKRSENSFLHWLQMVDSPHEGREEEILAKQQYESIWQEAQRFAGVLLGFYLLSLFAAYYMKRMGIEDHFLVRIYDTTLFKQLVLALFAFFAMVTVRLVALPHRIKSDLVLTLLWVLSLWWIFW